MNYQIIVHKIKTDGLPNMDKLTGKVAFIFDGCLVSGWPLNNDDDEWEANSDVDHRRNGAANSVRNILLIL